ncbi:phage tail protein [Polaribacter vadi]|uniref:phage tail protein n=1 Tax=Polaribacter vadi TaxID=1774273 RepID=UPI0030EB3335|tara:strand:+ start:4473 stop:6044 length:1572 start_codon:yes stop_codon:yes gene_type:complete
MLFGYTGEIRLVAFNFEPQGYMICDGRRLSKTDEKYKWLYAIIGDAFTYNTTDTKTFAIPDLRNRFVKHPGADINLGEQKGKDTVELSEKQMPEHNHNVRLEVDNTSVKELIKPKDAFLNNNAAVFSNTPSDYAFIGGVSEDEVGISKPIDIKNSHVKMIYVIRYAPTDPSENSLGEIRIWPNSITSDPVDRVIKRKVPKGWRLCNGDELNTTDNETLFSIIGDFYGGNPSSKFALPDFRNRMATGAEAANKVGEKGGIIKITLTKEQLPPHSHNIKVAINNEASSNERPMPSQNIINKNAGMFSEEISSQSLIGGIRQENKGGKKSIDITNSSLGLNYIICIEGSYKLKTKDNRTLGEIIPYAGFSIGEEKVVGAASCNGNLLPVQQNSALYSLLGTHYGGDGRISFKLPNLVNKIPLNIGNISEVGNSGGANKIRLSSENLPTHKHNLQLAVNNTPNGTRPNINNSILNNNAGPYSDKKSDNSFLGGLKEDELIGAEVNIRNPYLAINYLICIDGNFPERN